MYACCMQAKLLTYLVTYLQHVKRYINPCSINLSMYLSICRTACRRVKSAADMHTNRRVENTRKGDFAAARLSKQCHCGLSERGSIRRYSVSLYDIWD